MILAADLPQVGPVLPAAMATSIDALLQEWSNIDRLREGGVEPAMSALIYGQPGTGKTQLALWIGRQLHLPVVAARLDGLISSCLGTTSRNIGALFAFAERYRCLLLLDEFDAIAKMRDDPQEVGEIKRVVNTLLQSLDARKTVGPTIAITNHETLLDPAIWRRFDLQIGMPLPTREARIEMIHRYAPPLELTDTQVVFLSWCLSDVSGSEIETFLRSLKRSYLLNEDPTKFSLLGAVRSYVSLNANRLATRRASALAKDDEALALALRRDPDASPVDLGKLFGVHRATINRWLKSSSGGELAHA
ncbi:MAG: AAA family ATPase [Candidatus Eremiobacteraeota bacterium]|nr:AAA family ATPase [Candidatus Eremiobacteraeota bacterium]